MPVDIYGRDSALINGTDRAPTVGPLYNNPTYKNISPRFGFAWESYGEWTHLRSRGLWPVLQHQQSAEPDRHGDQSAGHAAAS